MNPQKWKQYGGVNKLDSYNNISVNSIVADTFTLKKAYYGTFDICGELHVSGNAIVDTTIKGNNLTIINDISSNRLFVNSQSTHYADMDVSGNLTVQNGNVYFYKNLNVSSNIYLRKQLFLGNSGISYINATDTVGKIGVNTTTPISAFDISSNQSFVINVSSSQDATYSTLAKNASGRAITLYTDSSSSSINFSNPSSSVNAYIQYYNPGVVTLSTTNNTNIRSTMSVSNRATYSPLTNDHIFGETVVIYDVSNGTTPYLYPIYQNASETSGDALTLVSNNPTSLTFMNVVTPSKNGLSMGGGTYPNDATRSFGTMGVLNTSGQYTPSINIVSGSSNIKQTTTVAINNYSPEIDLYSLDVNGPIHVKNGSLAITRQPTFEILQIKNGRTAPLFSVAVGTPYRKDSQSQATYYRQQILYTNNGGETWNSNFDLSGTSIELETLTYTTHNMNAVYIYDASLAVISGFNGFTAYTNNGGANWKTIALPSSFFASSVTSVYVTSNLRVFLGYSNGTVNWFDVSSNIYTAQIATILQSGTLNIGSNPITGIDGSNNTVFFTTTNSVHMYNANSGATAPSLNSISASTILKPNYTSISVFDPTHAVIVGTSVISYLNAGSWTDILTPYPLSSVYVYDTTNAMAVGPNGVVLYTNNGYATWSDVPTAMLNSGGNAARLIDSNYNLTNICMVSLNAFIISKTITSYVKNGVAGNTSVFNGYFPDLYNNVSNYVMDISGSLRISGDININDGGKLASNNSTFCLLNSGVQTIHVGQGASSLDMGSTGSTVTANYNLTVLHDSSLNGNALVGGNVSCYGVIKSTNYESVNAAGDMFIGGVLNTPSVSSRSIKIGNFNTTVNTVNGITIGGPQDTVTIGAKNIYFATSPQLSAPRFNLNVGQTSASAAGIYIGNLTSLSAGYVAVSQDQLGYVVKAPTSANIVKLDTNRLVLPTSTAKIVSLQPSTDIDSNYVVGVSSLDISNVLLKTANFPNYLSQPYANASQPVVDTSLSILGTSVSLGKYTNLIAGAQLDVSGNAVVSRLSIGTTSVNSAYALEVKGNVFQDSGGFIWQF